MKLKPVFILSLFFVLPAFLFSQQADSSDKNEIMKLLKTQEQKWNEGDLEGFMQGYWNSDSLRFISSKRISYGWQKTLDGYRKAYPDKKTMGTLIFEINSVEVFCGEQALVVGKWTLKREKDEPGGHFVLFLRKIEGKWLVVLDHTS